MWRDEDDDDDVVCWRDDKLDGANAETLETASAAVRIPAENFMIA